MEHAWRGFQRGLAPYCLRLELAPLHGKAATGVDHHRNARVGSAQYPAVLLHSTQGREVEMLAGCRGIAEPAVVADIYKNIGPVRHAVLGKPREYSLIADEVL